MASAGRKHFKAKGKPQLRKHKVRGLRNILIHVLLCIIAMLSWFNSHKAWKTRTDKGQ